MQIDGNTRLLCIFGDPVSHTLSPTMHNAALRAMELNIRYVPFLVKAARLREAVNGLRAMNFVGANVTIPHKVSVVPYMDALSSAAERTGAVNTIVHENGLLTGHNTDGEGFIRALEEEVKLNYTESPVFMAGSGGAARSVAFALAEKGVPQITLMNRTKDNAEKLAAILKRHFPSLELQIIAADGGGNNLLSSAKVVINSTPLGMSDQLKSLPMDVDRLSGDQVVCDLVYAKSQLTPLLNAARAKGATVLDGLGMLLHQGAVSLHLWTGIHPPLEVMRHAIESK